jgi:signal transduction histidine kinase
MVSRRVMELHGGNISVHSAGLGRGTEVTLSFPALADSHARGAAGTDDLHV